MTQNITDQNGNFPTETTNAQNYKIENVVATAIFDMTGEKIDLNKIARKYTDAEYNPERFPGLVLRFTNPKATTLIFSTGKLVVTGLINEENAENVVKKVLKVIKKTNFPVTIKEITIQNIVATTHLGKKVDLNMAAILLDNVMYEPEIFPGLTYRILEPENARAVFLIFSSGKSVCTGAKNRTQIKLAIEHMIKEFTDNEVFMKEDQQEEDIEFI